MPTDGLPYPPGSAPRFDATAWVVWAVDAEGVLLVHEGPGLFRTRLKPGDCVGRSVWEVHQGNPGVLAYVRRALSEPATAELDVNGCRFWDSATPLAGGGAVGLALALASAPEERQDSGDAPAPRVAELVRPLPEMGGSAGDLLVWSLEKPGVVGLYREIGLEGLPLPVVQELLALMNGSASAGSGAAADPGGTNPPHRERAAHLRLLP